VRDIFKRNLGYKVISLILAMGFWFWITSTAEDTGLFGERTLSVHLMTYNQPANLVIISDIPTISVRLDNENQGVNVQELFAYVDLQDAVAGEHSYPVKMDVPEGVTIKDISPKNVVLRMDMVKDKIVPVEVKVAGAPAAGYIAGQPLITPPVVNVRGATSILEKLEYVVVEANITGQQESIRIARPVTFQDLEGKGIFAPDPDLESLKAFPDTVEIVIPIYPKGTASKAVPIRVSTSGTPAAGMTVRAATPLPPRVELWGTEEALRGIQEINLGPVDVSGVSSNKVVDIPLSTIRLPEGVTFSEGTKLSVLLQVGPSSVNRVINDIPVGINNIPEGLKAETIESLDLTVSGYPDILDTIKPGDITVWVDAAGLEAGTHPDRPVHWKAPPGVAMVNVPTVELILKETESPPDANNEDNLPEPNP
jgi:YbbR domain-containing protein